MIVREVSAIGNPIRVLRVYCMPKTVIHFLFLCHEARSAMDLSICISGASL